VASPAVSQYLIDTSAFARATRPGVGDALAPIIDAGMGATCPVVELEALYTARSPDDYEAIRADRAAAYSMLPMDGEDFARALDVQRSLASRSQHRGASLPDLLIAACAERHRATVLHYDADYDLIAAVTGQPVRWVVPRGSAD
jgi:predicted nucleic acid-binding protein